MRGFTSGQAMGFPPILGSPSRFKCGGPWMMRRRFSCTASLCFVPSCQPIVNLVFDFLGERGDGCGRSADSVKYKVTLSLYLTCTKRT
jgi:hypothetical protein